MQSPSSIPPTTSDPFSSRKPLQQFSPTISPPVSDSKSSTPTPSLSHQRSPATSPPLQSRETPPTSSSPLQSTLSPSAPHFQTRFVDPPINIHALSISPTLDYASPLSPAISQVASSPVTLLPTAIDISFPNPLKPEAKTPTQGSFPLSQPVVSHHNSSLHRPTSPTVSANGSSELIADASGRTPNVYINGLPPNFPEEQLLAMCSEFGHVISVRTFTRHVSDKPSGYGFVLFGSVEAAERCIETLRKYRNLHPSYSKRIHKIPGTVYGSVDSSTSIASMQSTDSELSASDSFKARMERLKDTTSTNLYLEGLPLDINETTLSALVTPHRIMSSRFFKTRLSDPARIIAFVRLETRKGAEEIIERLHGRMVRGWRDTGCRISVRFADTSEQRELRRSERMTRDGDQSPSRLTIAQASLLNMKGNQLSQPNLLAPPLPNLGYGLVPDDALYDIGPNGRAHSPPPIGLQHLDRYHALDNPFLQANATLNTTLGRRLSHQDVLGAHAADFNVQAPPLRIPDHAYDLRPRPPVLDLASGIHVPAQARDGFTPVERMILQAHAARQQEAARLAVQGDTVTQMPRRLNTKLATRAMGNTGALRNAPRQLNLLPSMSEEDFHSGPLQSLPSQKSSLGTPSLGFSAAQGRMAKAPSRLSLDDINTRLNFTRQRNQTTTAARAQAQSDIQAIHARSSTLPSRYMSNEKRAGNSAYSSPRTEFSSSAMSAQDEKGVELGSASSNISFGMGTTSLATSNALNATNNNVLNDQPFPLSSASDKSGLVDGHVRSDTGKSTSHSHSTSHVPSLSHPRSDDEGSSLDSPALTHSTRTPATLSPSTPFSAFSETFDVSHTVTVANGGVAQGDVGLGMNIHDGHDGLEKDLANPTVDECVSLQ